MLREDKAKGQDIRLDKEVLSEQQRYHIWCVDCHWGLSIVTRNLRTSRRTCKTESVMEAAGSNPDWKQKGQWKGSWNHRQKYNEPERKSWMFATLWP